MVERIILGNVSVPVDALRQMEEDYHELNRRCAAAVARTRELIRREQERGRRRKSRRVVNRGKLAKAVARRRAQRMLR